MTTISSEQGCKFQKVMKCKTCSFILFKKCKKYRYAFIQWLLDDIAPITLRELKVLPRKNVYFFRSESLAKQSVAAFSIKNNIKVKKLTFNQVMSVTLDSEAEFVIPRLLYIECKRKLTDPKFQSCFESFIDRAMLSGSTVFIFALNDTINYNDSWVKFVTDTKLLKSSGKNESDDYDLD